jgi:predicted MPP superfamily phosphohydrolase
MISRRQFLRSAAFGAVALGAGTLWHDLRYDGYSSDFILENLVFTIPGLPPAFDGYRIGFLTDIHLGTWVPESWIERALASLREQRIDLLLLGGDYILVNESSLWDSLGACRNPTYSHLSKAIASERIYRSFARCMQQVTFPDGIFAVVGNHEHWNMFPVFEAAMRGHPTVQVLINREVSIKRADQELLIFGVDDYLTGIPSWPPSRELQEGRAARIILSHNPDYLTAILERPEHAFSLALCGHTHGGQIVLPALGPIAAQVLDRRFIAGTHLTNAGQIIYTSRGLGVVGLPFRFNCPAEVSVCTLKAT